MKILFNDLKSQWCEIQSKTNEKLNLFLNSGIYIDGPFLSEFEVNFAKYTNRKYAIGVSNGTDGLKLCIQAFNLKGFIDVIIPANGYIANILAVNHQPKQKKQKYNTTLIDCDDYYQIDVILLDNYLKNNRDKFDNCIIMPVHLYGHPSNMLKIKELAEKYNCYILEDGSQSHGAIENGKMIGTRADATVYSLYPGKNLGAVGDAGIITTDDDELYLKIKSLRNYGSNKKYYYEYAGYNHRMDPIQAIFLNEKLSFLDSWNDKKIKLAKLYDNYLKNNKNIIIPKLAEYADKHVYHIYCIRVNNRDKLQKFLEKNNIPTIIHYPIPIQKSKPFNYLNIKNKHNKNTLNWCNEIISLPIHQYLTEENIKYICDTINNFYTMEN